MTSIPNAATDRVLIVLGAGPTRTSIEDDHSGNAYGPSTNLTFHENINNGSADFGWRPHQGGGPADGDITLGFLSSGSVGGRVHGVLFWDALGGNGTVKAITRFQDRNGNTLHTRWTTVYGVGCCASDSRNQHIVDHIFQDPALFKILLTTGRWVNGTLVDKQTKTFRFGCN